MHTTLREQQIHLVSLLLASVIKTSQFFLVQTSVVLEIKSFW